MNSLLISVHKTVVLLHGNFDSCILKMRFRPYDLCTEISKRQTTYSTVLHTTSDFCALHCIKFKTCELTIDHAICNNQLIFGWKDFLKPRNYNVFFVLFVHRIKIKFPKSSKPTVSTRHKLILMYPEIHLDLKTWIKIRSQRDIAQCKILINQITIKSRGVHRRSTIQFELFWPKVTVHKQILPS